jgi:RNA polymerase sigma factor (sigma-70 family)
MARDGTTKPLAGINAFEAFYRREFRSVLGLAVVLTGSRSAGEDITQDAFTVTYREWERVGGLDNPGAWVRKVVANRSVSAFRRSVAEARALLRFKRQDPEEAAVDGLEVWDEVRKLPRRQAQVVALTYLNDLPRRDVAAVLGCSEETVKTHLERAKRTLAETLGQEDDR